jgi:hypothetical protein
MSQNVYAAANPLVPFPSLSHSSFLPPLHNRADALLEAATAAERALVVAG